MSVNNAFGCVAGYVLYDCGKVTGSDEQFGCIKDTSRWVVQCL